MSEFVMVKRELLEIIANSSERTLAEINDAIQQARAVLAQEAGHVEEPLGMVEAVQVATMPVERCYDVRAKMIIAFNESRKNGGDLDDGLDAAYKSALRYSPNPLLASLTVPVAATGMRDFANAMIDIALAGADVDGAHIQALAVEHSLLKPEPRAERCGEYCSCAEFSDFPVECFRKVKELNQ